MLLSFVFAVFELFSFPFLNFKSATLYVSRLLKYHSLYYKLDGFVFLLQKIKRIVNPISQQLEKTSVETQHCFSVRNTWCCVFCLVRTVVRILSKVEIANMVNLKEANNLKYKGFQVVSYFLSACSRHSKMHINLSQSTLD